MTEHEQASVVTLPFAGGVIALVVSSGELTIEVVSPEGGKLHEFWLSAEEMVSGQAVNSG